VKKYRAKDARAEVDLSFNISDNDLSLTFATTAESVYYNPRAMTSFERLQPRIARDLCTSLRRSRKHADEEEGEEDENDPAGRRMGLGGPLLRPHC